MKKIYFKRKPIKCPKCGHRPVASYVNGMPYYDEKLMLEVSAGKIVLGGCAIIIGGPKWVCTNCETEFYKKTDELIDEIG